MFGYGGSERKVSRHVTDIGISRGMASDIDNRQMSQMNPLSSRATATTTIFFCLPRAMSLR